MTLAEAMSVADVVALLRDEVKRLTKENEGLRSNVESNDRGWKELRGWLEIGPEESIFQAIQGLQEKVEALTERLAGA